MKLMTFDRKGSHTCNHHPTGLGRTGTPQGWEKSGNLFQEGQPHIGAESVVEEWSCDHWRRAHL